MTAPSEAALSWLPPAAAMLVLGGVLLLGCVKISVVLAVLRRGLGGVPPASLTALLSLLLSGLAMAPLYERCQRAMESAPPDAPPAERLVAGVEPLREFLRRRTPAAETSAVQELALRLEPASPPAGSAPRLSVLLVAFALSELRVAFQIGFVLLLPFLLIDLLCANLLAGLLLPGLSSRAVALPFKLLLFVVCDGWQLLARGLLSTYGPALGGSP